MNILIKSAAPLFFGLAFMMAGTGLLSTLLGLRAKEEGFDTVTTGLILSLYYLGYLGGAIFIPRIVARVGHIRVFAGLAAMVAAAALGHALLVTPVAWTILRIATGFCYVGLFVVVESWLNGLATNATRGRIMGFYLVVTYAGLIAGQFLLNAATVTGDKLFMLAALLVCLALVPISLSRRPAPEITPHAPINLRELWRLSPLSVTGVFMLGLGNAAMFAVGAIYAHETGMSVVAISLFMAAFVAGGIVCQMPAGFLSDRMDRRVLIGITAAGAAVTGTLCFVTASMQMSALLFICVFAHGSFALALYGICAAHANDRVGTGQYVGTSAALLLINGTGALAGPFAVSYMMDVIGTKIFFPFIAAAYAAIAGFAAYRFFILRHQGRAR